MKILLINQHTVPVFADIATAFATTGHSVTLFAGYVEEGSRRIPPEVDRISSVKYRRSSSLSRFLSWMLFTAHYSLHLLFIRRDSHILVTTNPPLAPIVTGWIAALRGLRYHVLVYDLYPEVLSQAGFMKPTSFLYRTWQGWNRGSFRRAVGIFTLSESMKSALTAYVDPSSVHVVSNWSDANYIRPIEKRQNSFIAKHGLIGKAIVMYSGNLGLTHDLESLVEAADILRNRDNCVFVCIGDGGKKKKLVAMKERLGLTNVVFMDYQSSEDFPHAVAAADIGIVTLGTGAEGISVPSKTYVNMGAGQCLIAICPRESELARIVNEFGVGYTVEPGRSAELADRINYLLDHPQELSAFKKKARETSMKFTSAMAEEYVRFIVAAG